MPLPQSRAGRALLAFWAVVLLAGLGTAGVLQWLGPPSRPMAAGRHVASLAPARVPDGTSPGIPAATARAPAPVPPVRPHLAAPVALARLDIAPPDAALLEPAPHQPGAFLPHVGRDGRLPRLVYAAPVPVVPAGMKRVAILLSGAGLSAADSLDAVDQLPGAVSLAVSPYSADPAAILDAARKAGHELLLSLPMDPERTPIDDEGREALSERASADENARRLEWSLSRIQGYVGLTNAAAGLDGEAFAASPQFIPIARAFAARGLFYLDAAPGTTPPPGVLGATADVRLDNPPDAASIDRQLAQLERIADGRGSAIGVAGPLFPVTIRRLADWIHALPTRGLVLVPVSSLMRAPDRIAATGTPGSTPEDKPTDHPGDHPRDNPGDKP